MNLIRFVAILLLLSIPCLAQQVDYRALGTNAFFTNALIVNSKHWTNQAGLYMYRPQGRSVDITGVNPGPDSFFYRNGSYYVGTNVTKDAITLANVQVPYVISMTASNEPSTVTADWWAIDSEAYGVYGGANLTVQQGGLSSFILSGDSGTETRITTVQAGPGQNAINVASNSVDRFRVSQGGDITIIKGVAYLWPIGYGAETNYVLTDTNKAGSLSWQPGLLSPTGTNIILSIASNAVSGGSASIGPGTPNFVSKFITSSNVTDSRLYEVQTNEWWWGVRTNLAAITNVNGLTNRFFGERTDATTYQSLILVEQPPALNKLDELRPDRGSGDARAMNKFRLWGSWDVNGFGTNTVEGNGHFLPFIDYVASGLVGLDLGSTAKRIRGIYAGKEIVITPSDARPLFAAASGGAGFGIEASGEFPTFWRNGFQTAGFIKERSSGTATFDLGGNSLVFGSSPSNSISGFMNSSLVGYVQVGMTNSGAAAPSPQGLIGAQATGTDKGGSDLVMRGGTSTGTGTNGNFRVQTAEKANSTSAGLNTATQKDRIFVIADPIILTTNSATIVANITIPTALRGVGGTVHAHTEIENGVDIATTDETFTFTANRKGSTVVTGISAPITCTSSSGGSAAIANTWNAVANSTSVDLKLTCVTSGILSTNSTVRVTLIPNSSAVPIISHP